MSEAGKARLGGARQGQARPGRAGQAGLGGAGQGAAWQGRAGQAGQSVEVAGVSAPVAQAVRQVYEQCGGVEFAERLVAAAEQPESPLHSLFTWDNDAAAAEWRLEQARSLVRRVHVRVIRGESADPIQVRAYLSRRELPSAEATPAGTYVAIEEVAGATDWETSVLQEINRDVAVAAQVQARQRVLQIRGHIRA